MGKVIGEGRDRSLDFVKLSYEICLFIIKNKVREYQLGNPNTLQLCEIYKLLPENLKTKNIKIKGWKNTQPISKITTSQKTL